MKGLGYLGRLALALTLTVAGIVAPVNAATVSKSFTTHSQASSPLLVFGGESFNFTVSGTFVGTVKLQRSLNGVDYKDFEPAISTNAAYNVNHFAEGVAPNRRAWYRVYASTHTSGTIVTSLADIDDQVQVFANHKGATTFTIKDDSVEVATALKVPYPAVQVIGAGGTVAADACGGIKRISATAARTTDTTNTFAAPSGVLPIPCVMDVYNDSAFAITLDNNAKFMSAGAADVVLGSSDTVRVFTNGTVWVQLGATGNN